MSHYGLLAVGCFFCGALIFQWRQYIPLNKWIFIASLAAVYLITISPTQVHEVLQYAELLFLAYVTVYIGFIPFPQIRLLQGGDYSYGIYLYGFPIAQTLVATLSPLRGHPLFLLVTGIPATFAFAALSWHFFEKPALRLKRYVTAGGASKVFVDAV